jgi:hypothetical protein
LAGEFAIARLVAKTSLSGRGGPVDLLVARHIGSAVNRRVGANVLLLEFVDVRVERDKAGDASCTLPVLEAPETFTHCLALSPPPETSND